MKALGIIFLSLSCFLNPCKTEPPAHDPTGHLPETQSDPPVYQIIICEIMADPTPQVALPDKEYIEIYNRGNTQVELTNWKLIIGNYVRTIPAISIEPHEYRIVCDAEAEGLFSGMGKTVPINNMPPILNSGQVIILKSPSDKIVHALTFSDSWYQHSEKASGGWSLEIIDPENPCGGAENWRESCDVRGGSPGIINTANAQNPDNTSPFLLRVTMPDVTSLLLHFSEQMTLTSVTSPGQYSVNNEMLHPSGVYPVEPDYSCVRLSYPEAFDPEHRYSVTVLHTLQDCAGNMLKGNAMADFALSQPPGRFDLIFNELLFESPDTLSEFIELYNRSDKVLDLSAFSIALADTKTGISRKTIDLDKNPFILFPESYVVITKKSQNLPSGNSPPDPAVVLEHSGLFAFPDDEGLLVLLDTLQQTIDEFKYIKTMHSHMLSNTTGVSLERINPDHPSSDPNNWHSASTASGYSTPGLQNSQRLIPEDNWGTIALQLELCSPDNDGVDDAVTLHLQIHEPGWMATIAIFDAGGNHIKNLISHGIVGTDSYFTWDGKRTDERVADPGIYIVWIELFSPAGAIKNFKKVIPLVRRL